MESPLGTLEAAAYCARSPVAEGRWDLSALVQDRASKPPTKHTARLRSEVREQTGSKAKHGSGEIIPALRSRGAARHLANNDSSACLEQKKKLQLGADLSQTSRAAEDEGEKQLK